MPSINLVKVYPLGLEKLGQGVNMVNDDYCTTGNFLIKQGIL